MIRTSCFALGLAFTCLTACLDFDQFSTEPSVGQSSASSTGTGQGGAGGATTTVGTGGMGGAGGMGGTGGEGGGGFPVTSPCFGGADELTDTFDGPELDWVLTVGTADYSAGNAVLTKPSGSEIELDRNTYAGVLDECHFQIELVKADVATVYVQFRSTSNPLGQNFGFHVEDGVAHAQLVPGSGDLPLLDDSPMTSGFVRIGESGGTYFIGTAPVVSGPWTLRYTTMAPPSWLTGDGFLVLGISSPPGSPDTAVFDNLNLP